MPLPSCFFFCGLLVQERDCHAARGSARRLLVEAGKNSVETRCGALTAFFCHRNCLRPVYGLGGTHDSSAPGAADFNFAFIDRCLIAGRAVWFYLYKLLWPANLIFIYPRWNIDAAVVWQYLFPAAFLLAAVLFWGLRNRSRAPLAVLLYFAVTLFPALGFFNVYPFRYSFVADHFQYLACIGPIAAAAAGIVHGNRPA